MSALTELERRVGEKWAAAAAARAPQWPQALDMNEWFGAIDAAPLPPGAPQFPRAQWATYPANRAVVLTACDRLLDSADELTDEQWMAVCMLMQYGGKTRIA